MSSLITAIKRHPAITYFALVFAISWGGILAVAGPNIRPASGAEIGRLMPPMYLAMMAGPSVSGILLVGLVYGRAGFKQVFSALIKWRVGAHWYAIALLTTPVLATAALLGLSLISPDFLPRIYTSDDKAFILQFAIVVGLMVGLTEELGSTGFALPTLRRGNGILVTGLMIGLLEGARHLPVVYFTSTGATGNLPPALYLSAVLFSWLPSYRVLTVCVYERTQSLLVAFIMHASLIAFWYILTPIILAGVALVAFYLVFSAGVWVVIAVLLRLQNLRFRNSTSIRMIESGA
jgi:membrane protease YdiL (CAAX protease family)